MGKKKNVKMYCRDVIDENGGRGGKKLKNRFFQTAESHLIMREKTLPPKLNLFF